MTLKALPGRAVGAVAVVLPVLAGARLLLAATALAQSPMPGGMPPPPGMSLAQSTAMRFPQPVRVGNLIGHDVLQPVESRILLGTVGQVVRGPKDILVVVRLHGFLGFGARPVAVPLDAMVLLGNEMEVVAFTPAQLKRFPTFRPTGTTPLPPDAVVSLGLAKPSH